MMTQKLGNGFEFIKKACFVCGSFNHLIKDCDFHDNKMVEKPVLNNKGRVTGQREIRPVWNNAQRVNHQNKLTHPHPKRNFVPTAVATKSGQVPVNAAKQSSPRAAASISTARPVNTAAPKPKEMGKMLLSPQHAGYGDQQEMLLTITPKTMDHTCLKDLTIWIKQNQLSNAWIIKKMMVDLLHLEESPKGVKNYWKEIPRKIDEKADEGFFIGYFINSKTFRVFNTRTRKVEENLHTNFLENKPNFIGSGPDWLFDIDLLTNIMNYEPVTVGNQTNKNAAELDNLLAQQKECYAKSTNRDSTVSPFVSTAGQIFTNADDLLTDPIADLGILLDLLTMVSLVVHMMMKDMDCKGGCPRFSKEHAGHASVTSKSVENNTKLFKTTYLPFFVTYRSKKVTQALTDPSWIEAMQDALLQNKKYERGIVVRNKARLVSQGYTHEEDIEYDEVFAPVARIEAIRAWYETFSSYLLENGFRRGTIDKSLFIKKDKGDILLVQVYVDDIIFESTNKSLCVELGYDAQEIPDKFYKGRHFILRVTTSTPIVTNKALLKDEEAEVVDVHLYILMIGSLMYLTASRPDIMFIVCAYERDSPFNLEAFFYSDYARASLNRKSTTRGGDEAVIRSWVTDERAALASTFRSRVLVPTAKIHIRDVDAQKLVENLELEIMLPLMVELQDCYETSIRRHSSLKTLMINFSKGTLFPSMEIFDPYHPSLFEFRLSTSVDVRHGGVVTTVTSLDAGHGSGLETGNGTSVTRCSLYCNVEKRQQEDDNPNGSNLLQQDLEQIHKDDLEAMDLNWQFYLLSMRAKRYYQRIGKKIFINANDTAGYDKSKVECFNCHKMRHFARECRAPRNKEGQFRNQDNTRKQGNNEDISSNAMLAIDGVGFDWSDMTKEQCDDLIVKLNQTEFTAATYKRGLATVEEQLITYRKNEVLFSEEVAVLKREVACKDYEINVLKTSKDLDKLLGSQITDKSKKGLGYSAVPPPHPLIYNRPKKLDLSYSGLDEFKEPEFKAYGSEVSKQESNVVCDKKSDDSKENSDDSLVKEQVSKDTSSFVESSLNVDKETVFPVDKKVEFVKPKNHEKPVKKSVRPRAGNTARSYTGPVNAVRAKGDKPQQNDIGFVDSGCSRHMTRNIAYLSDFKKFDGGYVTFGGGAHGGRISGKGTLKTDSLDFEDETDIHKRTKNKAKDDKTEHGMEKREKTKSIRSQSQPGKSQQSKPEPISKNT
ncbi:ribonuclease H-like domain-containing protein [Tanacetum coccineum]